MSIKQIKPVIPPAPFEAYGHVISPLSVEDGGGYMITFPDLPGCMSDGETQEEALANGRDAFDGWMAAQVDMGRQMPVPTHYDEEGKPVKFVQRLPRSLHASLQTRAKAEGVSINTLVLALIAEGLGRREATVQNPPAKRAA
ncbi:toxin-antitoxin system HicB family antitoxin [Oryzomonas japonica]|uniref:Toxin-antitoxin system HicB family antitoxin n=1 Tax=Oryzomonas japonica TaxID=2603858 RepID=A0A7J4ZQX6_9BACT|nr:type II toxin-antitoxin system HicB family antitoxin [Oryzomonas japonica]KAB0665584.1 toxin-antitoxin system HicB family antitoxin [Oryzomonas japonica]